MFFVFNVLNLQLACPIAWNVWTPTVSDTQSMQFRAASRHQSLLSYGHTPAISILTKAARTGLKQPRRQALSWSGKQVAAAAAAEPAMGGAIETTTAVDSDTRSSLWTLKACLGWPNYLTDIISCANAHRALGKRAVVVGAGPAGLLTAILLPSGAMTSRWAQHTC